jgi:hypothetical protein
LLFQINQKYRHLLADLGWEFSHIFSVEVATSQVYPLLHFEQTHRYIVGSVPGMLVPGKKKLCNLFCKICNTKEDLYKLTFLQFVGPNATVSTTPKKIIEK